ncbi:sensor histidine kinase [Shewanella sp.]|uniref:sensor histidine kinase n=1 Tax=Shewanella sp. TaxID=50422 RepID=UPI003569309A
MIESLEAILLEVSRRKDIDDGDLSAASKLILYSCCEGLQIERAGIWLLSAASESITCNLLLDRDSIQQTEALTLTRHDFPNYFRALDSERRIAADDAHTHQATAEFSSVYLAPQNISSMLDVPIRHRGKMIGIICCEHRGPARQWTEDEVVFAAAMADLYGRAISAQQRHIYQAELELLNASLEEKVKERTENLQNALTNLTLAQDRLVESEKLAALGSLVAGVAHEVNTPLGIAVTSVSLCQDELRQIRRRFEADDLDAKTFKQYIETVEEGLFLALDNLSRAATLLQDFKRTAADQAANELEAFELCEYIRHMLTPLNGMLKKQGVKISLDLKGEIYLQTYPGIIAQVLTNLITNAINHGFKDLPPNANKQIEVAVWELNNQVMLQVKDNGCGIPADNIQKIFEPFFTTARANGGTGLGLSICYNLINKKLHGTMQVASELGKGSTFSISFPNQANLAQHS